MTPGPDMRPRSPITLDAMVDDPEALVALIRGAGPFPPLQRGLYRTAGELAAMGNSAAVPAGAEDQPPPARSSFRKFFARNGDVVVNGGETLLRSQLFIESALALHEGLEVRPMEVYVNVNVPESNQRSAHTDVPDFRGLARRQVSSGVLTTMRRSGLFERWRIATAAVVGWIYEGRGGEYTYWPDGPSRPARRTTQPFSNTAIVGENDIMFHRGEPVVAPDGSQPGVPGMTLTADLWPVEAGHWRVMDAARVLADLTPDQVRLCISWTGQVIRDAQDRRMIDDHLDDLTVERIEAVFTSALVDRGEHVPTGMNLLDDPRGLALLARAYAIAPVEEIVTA
jgi:hypothetical protein